MSRLKGKFLKSDSVDGSKIKLLDGQSLRIVSSDGSTVELLKMQDGKAYGPQGELATPEYFDAAISTVIDNAPEALDTLKELSDALGGDPQFNITLNTRIAELEAELDAVVVGSAVLANRNLIINGDMSIWQRGESASNITSAGYVAVDRFSIINYLSSASVTVEKIDTGLADFPNAVRYRVVSVSSASDINLIANIEQRIEGINCQRLGFGQPNKKITLSFWCRSSLTGTITGSLWAKQNDRVYQFPVTINSADTWERKVVTMPADSVPLANDNLDALRVTLNIGGGTARRNAPPYGPNVWGDFYYSDSAAYLNTMFITETAGATFDLTGVQLEAGDVATPFEHLPYQENLNRCMRYYQEIDFQNAIVFDGYYSTGNYMTYFLPRQSNMAYNPSSSIAYGSVSNLSEVPLITGQDDDKNICIRSRVQSTGRAYATFNKYISIAEL